ncbi:hypothetical protein GUJ93_ZPchr0005g16369 [Zizania palustris]|uniref:Uncharacterized protein n=1 Tax=Zizania palustris TaxID=103762 RepID=A0A8J5SBP3_ZIZPA|nr:hypothetical protein GUJ93_ZPchr0005g16369 [Zizania palustris]
MMVSEGNSASSVSSLISRPLLSASSKRMEMVVGQAQHSTDVAAMERDAVSIELEKLKKQLTKSEASAQKWCGIHYRMTAQCEDLERRLASTQRQLDAYRTCTKAVIQMVDDEPPSTQWLADESFDRLDGAEGRLKQLARNLQKSNE